MASIRSFLSFTVLFIALIAFGEGNQAMAEVKPAALIVKIEGNGQAFVRRKNRQQLAASISLPVYAGDSITTDSSSAVEILYPEGSLVRVGLNSEYKIASADKKKGFVSWVFELTKGSIRGLIEKSGDKENVRVRVNTPAGTMGVRGTEFLLEHDERSGLTRLFTLHGLVEFGARSCISGKGCVEVGTQKMSTIKIGDKFPSKPKGFGAEELLKSKDNGDGASMTVAASDQQAKERLVLLFGVKKASQVGNEVALMDKERLEKMVKEAEAELQQTQDFLMGRDEELRKAMHAAKDAGSFDDHLKLADKFTQMAGVEVLDDEGATGVREAKKFALARAILKAEEEMNPRAEKEIGPLGKKRANSAGGAASGGLKSSSSSFETQEIFAIPSARVREAMKALSKKKVDVEVQKEEVKRGFEELRRMEDEDCDLLDIGCHAEEFVDDIGDALGFNDDPEPLVQVAPGPAQPQPNVPEELHRDMKDPHFGPCVLLQDLCKDLERRQKDKKDREEEIRKNELSQDKEDDRRSDNNGNGIIREGGKCYRQESGCTQQVVRCDLSTGKKCKSGGSIQMSCGTRKVEVACPGNSSSKNRGGIDFGMPLRR